jgi:hypothetical protein
MKFKEHVCIYIKIQEFEKNIDLSLLRLERNISENGCLEEKNSSINI